ncbi:MAG: hypothetical protein RL154_1663 [Pseudomonadota bacterium]|jgi:two-component system chemotaxis sensor kinase CheA
MKKLYYYLALAFYFFCAFAYSYNSYINAKENLIANIDNTLKKGALSVNEILPNNFFNQNMQKDDISLEQDQINIEKLSKEAEILGLQYVYALIMNDGNVTFAASSATKEELKLDENISHYFDVYDDASVIAKQAFSTKSTLFDETQDKWGHFKSIFIPQVGEDGSFYIVGADIRIDFIEDELNNVLKQAIFEVLFFTIILIPLFLAYYFQNRDIQNFLETKVQEKTKQVKTLLNNANQGFLSFSSDMLIHKEYSAKCSEIFNQTLENKNIAELLFEQESESKKFHETLLSLLGDSDDVRVDAILSLLKNEFILGDKIVAAEYKIVNSTDFMIILTDITDTKALQKRLNKERQTLKMIVSSVVNEDELFELLNEYKNFIEQRIELVNANKTPLHNLSELYRIVHTFKGNFAQKDFITTPQGLHKLEARLSKFLADAKTTNEEIIAVLKKVELETWLAKDIDLLTHVLGEDFFDDEDKFSISKQTLEELEHSIKISSLHLGLKEYVVNEIISEIQKIKRKPLCDMLSSYPKMVEQITAKMGKEIYHIKIDCDRKLFVNDSLKPFIRTLVHIFRNSVDHGIELPDYRAEIGKDEIGTISCVVSEDNSGIVRIVIADDGAGIDTDKVAKKAVELGCCTQEDTDKMSTDEIAMLIFNDRLSTKEEVSELSGRGVGLAAVKAELEKIGGTMSVSTQAGIGATFAFYISKKG